MSDSSSHAVTPETQLRVELRDLDPYHVEDASGMIKLDAMENPYPWPGELRSRWVERLASVEANRYPDPHAMGLKQDLRRTMNVPDGAALLLGNGSDEIIQLLAMALALPGGTLVAPDPSFSMYRMIARFLGLGFAAVPLSSELGLDPAGMLAAIPDDRPSLVFIAQPNNPTGNLFDPEDVLAVVRSAPCVVVVDEAYFPFTDHSLVDSVLRHPNLLVMRTLSKLGLAGLRLGFLVGASQWIVELEKLRMPYNVNTLTQASAAFALEHYEHLTAQARRIREDRARLASDLDRLPGVTVFSSETNFLLFRVPRGNAQRVFEGLRERGVLIKNLSPAGGALEDCLRVTVGSPAEVAAFMSALTESLAERAVFPSEGQ